MIILRLSGTKLASCILEKDFYSCSAFLPPRLTLPALSVRRAGLGIVDGSAPIAPARFIC
jgi:hypothetical protein